MKKEFSVAIFGFGDDGQCTLSFLQKNFSGKIAVFDEQKKNLPQGVIDFTGEKFDEKELSNFSLVFRSPGIRPEKLSRAKVTNTTSNFFLKNFPGTTLGITGSNGKTTVTNLVADIFGQKAIRGGNDARPLLEILPPCSIQDYLVGGEEDCSFLPFSSQVRKKTKKERKKISILELSSFQLLDIEHSPQVACITNISPNHLDWHLDATEYQEAKKNIFRFQESSDCCVLNWDDPASRELASDVPGEIFWVGKKGANSAWQEKGKLYFYIDGKEVFSFPVANLRAKTHLNNFLLAGSVALLGGTSTGELERSFSEFEGVKERLELVRTWQGQNIYNDSASTTPESTIVAITAFPRGTQSIMVGGRNKGMKFRDLAKVAKENQAFVLLYGEAKNKIKEDFEKEGFADFAIYDESKFDFLELIKKAIMTKRENIIFSPACASFDLFKNAKERGRLFDVMVKSISRSQAK